MMNIKNPKVFYEFEFNFLKVISFYHLIEDRRPDLIYQEAQEQLGYKYKHQIKFRFFSKRISIVLHSLNPGFIAINNKEVDYNNE